MIDKKLLKLAKKFFDFGEHPDRITIVLPSFERTRESTLKCKNYPLYKFEVSPDDVKSALQIYHLLNMIYPGMSDRIEVDSIPVGGQPTNHAIFIGGPHTNRFVGKKLSGFPIRFDTTRDHEDRHLTGPGMVFRIKKEKNYIVEDYCLISKRDSGHRVEFIFAGLRAYGQEAVKDFLGDVEFYRQVEPLLHLDTFQIVVKVTVNKTNWLWDVEVIEPRIYKYDAFLCYSHGDGKRVRRLAADLRRSGVRVWLDVEQEGGGDPTTSWIERGLRDSRFVLPCISGNLKGSQWCQVEYEEAIREQFERDRKLVIPVKIAEHGPEDVPFILRGRQRVDVTTEAGVRRLVRELSPLLREQRRRGGRSRARPSARPSRARTRPG